MAGYLESARAKLESVLGDYELGRVAKFDVLSVTSTDSRFIFVTPDGQFLLKLSKLAREHDLKRELELLLFLTKHSFPSLVPLADRYGRLYRDHCDLWLSIYRLPPGTCLSVNALTSEQLKEVGKTLANFHMIGKGYKKGVETRSSFDHLADLYWRLRSRLPNFFNKICRILDEEFDYLRRYLEPRLPKGLIHNGFCADRLLFCENRLTSITAFDSATRGKFITDLATAINALCFVGEQYNVERFRSITSGYESVRTLSLSEWDAFPNELRYSALRSVVMAIAELIRSNGVVNFANAELKGCLDRLQVLRREKPGGMEEMLMAMATGYDYRKYQRVKLNEKNCQ